MTRTAVGSAGKPTEASRRGAERRELRAATDREALHLIREDIEQLADDAREARLEIGRGVQIDGSRVLLRVQRLAERVLNDTGYVLERDDELTAA